MKKKLLTLAVAAVAAVGLVACNGGGTNASTSATKSRTSDEFDDYRAYVLADLKFDFDNVEAEKNNLSAEVYGKAKAAYDAGVDAIYDAKGVGNIKKAYDDAEKAILAAIPAANGVYDFSSYSVAQKRDLTALVEKYAVATGLTGLTLYETGGYSLVNPRVTLGTENYILSYGFGILAEGSINAPLEAETNAAWKNYYHSFETSDPATANYWNDKGAQAGDLYGYFNASLFTTFMNDTKDSYKWVGELSKDDRPVAVDKDGHVINATESDTWRVKIKTGADGLKYNTLSTIASRAAFKDRLVVAEDYLTPYKVQLTQHNQLFRGGEYAGSTSVKIDGLSAYYNATKDTTALYDDDLWNRYVGDNLKVYKEGDDWYFQWTNTQKTNAFYAMYYIASSMYSPIPADFVNLVTVKNLFGYNSDKSETPIDNSLSLGAYVLEAWETDKAIVYKKNPNYVFANTKYKIEGVHLAILAGMSTDEDLAVKEFLAGKIDQATITQNYLDKYKNDPQAHFFGSGSNFKLNLNTTNAKTWEYYFGEEGVVSQAAKADYWDLEPAMSNLHFVRGLSYALNRKEIADAHAAVPSFSYLGGVYMSDPENGEFYNSTDAHKNAIKFFTDDTDGYGYSLELARDYFKWALKELEASGAYTRGTKENPTVINLEIAWMYPNQEDTYHSEVKECLEAAFNDPSVSDGCYELNVEFWAGDVWSDVYYKKLMKGNFDLGFGSISGNTYNILDYLTVLSADQTLSGGFTLNWGPQTDNPDQWFLLYKGAKWSFDALLSAANGSTIVKDGKIASAFELDQTENYTVNTDGTVTVEVKATALDGLTFEVDDVVAFGYTGGVKTGEYVEESVLAADKANLVATKNADGSTTFKVTVSQALFNKYSAQDFYPGAEGSIYLDFYYKVSGKIGADDFSKEDIESLLFGPAEA